MPDPKLLDLEAEYVHETEYAWLVMVDGEKYWVPKSQCEFDDGMLTLPEWLAIEKGMI